MSQFLRDLFTSKKLVYRIGTRGEKIRFKREGDGLVEHCWSDNGLTKKATCITDDSFKTNRSMAH